MPLSPVDTLRQLIRIPSVNPMAGNELGADYGETRLTDHLEKLCSDLKLGWLRQQVHPGRDNLLAVLPGQPGPEEGGRLLLWDVHQDTVAVDGMTVDPFAATVRDGRVYGRGACDVKGGMAAMLVAISRLSENRQSRRPTILLAFTVNEECGFTGARALSRLWQEGPALRVESREEVSRSETPLRVNSLWPSTLDPQLSTLPRPDAAIVAEPTDLNVVVAHKGVVRWRCHTLGRAAHTSQPERGDNAIYAMAGVVRAIERYHLEVAPRLAEHPLCGAPTVCVSTIAGGVGVNTVPERASIDVDRRLTPDEDPRQAIDRLIRFIAENADVGRCRVVHDEPLMISRGLSDAANRRWAEAVVQTVRPLRIDCQVVGARYGTNAAEISDAGVPTVVLGPGSIDQAHTADEWIAIDHLELAAEIYYELGRRL